jgi:hypothetical protein
MKLQSILYSDSPEHCRAASVLLVPQCLLANIVEMGDSQKVLKIDFQLSQFWFSIKVRILFVYIGRTAAALRISVESWLSPHYWHVKYWM